MHIDIFFSRLRNICYQRYAIALFFLFLVCIAAPTNADYSIVGDVDGFDPATNAGGTTGTLIVGDTDLGGLLGDGEQVLGGVIPLESPSAIIGDGLDGIGAVTLNDSASRWDITSDLTIGNEGQGLLTVGTSATVDVDGNTILGLENTGFGILEINGTVFPGARIRTSGLTVGDLGLGIIEITDRGSLVSEISDIGSTGDTGDGVVTLNGLGTRWSVRDALTVGGLAGTSHGKVSIQNDAVLQVDSTSTLTINPRGTVDLAGGTLRMLPQITNTIINDGLIVGDGFIDGGITIGVIGEVRNAGALVQNGSTVTRQREHLSGAEAVENNGTIQSLGGAMDFEALVTNNLEIVARDAEMHFRAGVLNENDGVISIGGDTTLHGDIANNGGDIFVLSGSESLMVGDLTFTGSSILGLTVGPEAGTLDVTGAIILDPATIIALDYSAGVFPQVDDTYQILHANQGISGVAMGVIGQASAGGVLWDIENTGSTLIATNTGAVATPNGADFNGDGIVDQLDIIIWENNFGNSGTPGDLAGIGDADGDGDVDGSDFFKIQMDFGGPPTFVATAVAAVPEPSTMAIGLLALVCCPRRRSRG